MKTTGLVSNDQFMKTLEIAYKVMPESVAEKKTLKNIWLAMDEVQAKVQLIQGNLFR
jgi:hypothetical protein